MEKVQRNKSNIVSTSIASREDSSEPQSFLPKQVMSGQGAVEESKDAYNL